MQISEHTLDLLITFALTAFFLVSFRAAEKLVDAFRNRKSRNFIYRDNAPVDDDRVGEGINCLSILTGRPWSEVFEGINRTGRFLKLMPDSTWNVALKASEYGFPLVSLLDTDWKGSLPLTFRQFAKKFSHGKYLMFSGDDNDDYCVCAVIDGMMLGSLDYGGERVSYVCHAEDMTRDFARYRHFYEVGKSMKVLFKEKYENRND